MAYSTIASNNYPTIICTQDCAPTAHFEMHISSQPQTLHDQVFLPPQTMAEISLNSRELSKEIEDIRKMTKAEKRKRRRATPKYRNLHASRERYGDHRGCGCSARKICPFHG